VKTAAAESATSNLHPDLHIAITIKNEATWRRAMTNVRTIVEKAVHAALSSQPALPEGVVQLSILLTSDAEVRRLNKLWRGQDKPTNVLSFPADQFTFGKQKKNKKSVTQSKPILLGDVVIARETILREARSEKKTPRAHVSHLIVHGVLHLLGYDHERSKAAKIMEKLERQILDGLNITDPYAPTAARAQSRPKPTRPKLSRLSPSRKGRAA